jgi:hypothetical protein
MPEAQTRRQLIASTFGRQVKPPETSDIDWNDLCERINDKQVIPFISSSLSYDAIFADLLQQFGDKPDAFVGNGLRIGASEVIAENWAAEIGYPLPDSSDLSRVAQYYCSTAKDNRKAKTDFLRFLKNMLLDYARSQGEKEATVEILREGLNELSYTELAKKELGYPKYPSHTSQKNPLDILAGLPLPVYVTTSHHNFLELALEAHDKQPVSQACFWDREILLDEDSEPYIPDVSRPLVYHFFGQERQPTTMVLSEDDYLEFLIKATRPVDAKRPLIPNMLLSALSQSSVIMIGYRLMDWDFRVLSRGVLQSESRKHMYNWIVQLSPDKQYQVDNVEDARKCLVKYLEPKQLYISWGQPEQFLSELERKWNVFWGLKPAREGE